MMNGSLQLVKAVIRYFRWSGLKALALVMVNCWMAANQARAETVGQMKEPQSFETIGVYNCYSGAPSNAVPFLRACGYNTYQRWDLGWTLRPSRHDAYYAELMDERVRMKAGGFRYYGLLSVNMRQCGEGQPEGYRDNGFNPRDTAAMAERLQYLTRTIKNWSDVDGFTIVAGDPGGCKGSRVEDLWPAVRQVVDLIRQHAPQAPININTWGIAAWDHFPSPYKAIFWDKEVELSKAFYESPGLLGSGIGLEFPLHNYYRNLALSCYAGEKRDPPLFPTRSEVQAYAARGATRLWGWPYFLVDEAEAGYKWRYGRGTPGASEAETRYIKAIIDTGRGLRLNGMFANCFAENIVAEVLNLFAFGQFCQFPEKSPKQVIEEFAAHLAEPSSVVDLSEVLCFIENNSSWEKQLPVQRRLPSFDLKTIRSVTDAMALLHRVKANPKPGLPLPESAAAYLARLKERLQDIQAAERAKVKQPIAKPSGEKSSRDD